MTREAAIKELDAFKRTFKSESLEKALDLAIESLKLIPDNATNGEVIKAVFPKWEQLNGNSVWLNGDLDDYTHVAYTTDWWNAPYGPKKESEVEA